MSLIAVAIRRLSTGRAEPHVQLVRLDEHRPRLGEVAVAIALLASNRELGAEAVKLAPQPLRLAVGRVARDDAGRQVSPSAGQLRLELPPSRCQLRLLVPPSASQLGLELDYTGCRLFRSRFELRSAGNLVLDQPPELLDRVAQLVLSCLEARLDRRPRRQLGTGVGELTA